MKQVALRADSTEWSSSADSAPLPDGRRAVAGGNSPGLQHFSARVVASIWLCRQNNVTQRDAWFPQNSIFLQNKLPCHRN